MMPGYEKVLDQRSKLTQNEVYRLLQEKDENKNRAVVDLTNYYEAKLREKASQIDQLLESRKKSLQVLEATQKDMAEETESKIRKLKSKHKMRLREEKKENTNLIEERGFLKKKLTNLQQKMDEQKNEIEESRLEITDQADVILILEKEIIALKNRIDEVEGAILEEAKMNEELRKQNGHLTTFQLVQESKIRELQNLLQPRDNSIKELNDKIKEMENELEAVNRENVDLRLNIEELKQTLVAKDKEFIGRDNVIIMEENASLKKVIDDLRRDLQAARSQIQHLEISLHMKRKKNKSSSKYAITSAGAVTEKEEFKDQTLPMSDVDPWNFRSTPSHLPPVNQIPSEKAVIEEQPKDSTEIVTITKLNTLPGRRLRSGPAVGLPPLKRAPFKK